ncbi:hypothetical protein C9374_006536 [Naegleria lovaniensis]|uniref:RWP-RK domain-containing protein n=1 Tax=Naegleria lovaniensis TaxID=51637 RepID=A0AA88GHC0_NAELO|nr:uncharacterized protein C9374_006536 [Naegleria lovaniensis]KAG2379419.1 hypothetical protein C9374_006536 [Naegleria lovaniensis]
MPSHHSQIRTATTAAAAVATSPSSKTLIQTPPSHPHHQYENSKASMLPSIHSSGFFSPPHHPFYYNNNHHHHAHPIPTISAAAAGYTCSSPRYEPYMYASHHPSNSPTLDTHSHSQPHQHYEESNCSISNSASSASHSAPSPHVTKEQNNGKGKRTSRKSSISSGSHTGHATTTTSTAQNSGIVKKKRKTKKNKIIIATSELVRCMNLPQTVAAKKLKVSLSTLKRRFYELGIGRWPAVQGATTTTTSPSANVEEVNAMTTDLSYVNCGDVEPQQKLSLSFIMHKKDFAEPSVVDNLSMVILKVAFTLNTAEEK